MTCADDARALLMAEGDRLARRLAQQLSAPVSAQERLVFYGRSLALNLVQATIPTIEQITRRMAQPLYAQIIADGRGRAAVQTVTQDGEPHGVLSADDLLEAALFSRAKLHPTVRAELLGALHGSEHAATQALIRCLKSPPVLEANRRYLQHLLR